MKNSKIQMLEQDDFRLIYSKIGKMYLVLV